MCDVFTHAVVFCSLSEVKSPYSVQENKVLVRNPTDNAQRMCERHFSKGGKREKSCSRAYHLGCPAATPRKGLGLERHWTHRCCLYRLEEPDTGHKEGRVCH